VISILRSNVYDLLSKHVKLKWRTILSEILTQIFVKLFKMNKTLMTLEFSATIWFRFILYYCTVYTLYYISSKIAYRTVPYPCLVFRFWTWVELIVNWTELGSHSGLSVLEGTHSGIQRKNLNWSGPNPNCVLSSSLVRNFCLLG